MISLRALTLGTILAGLPVCAAPVAWAQEEDSEPHVDILTDTPGYCNDLARLVSMRDQRPAEVDRLAEEGREMCDRGEVRGGILRLRRAVRILNLRAPSDPP